jgi:lipopolysaccharide/colanic/teichoic acid biosynthesis glycosyltransferase
VVESWQQRRDECPAGFVGLWFVQDTCDDNLDATLVADVYYVATRSGKHDVQLLLQVPRSWVRRIKRPMAERHFVRSAMQEHRI